MDNKGRLRCLWAVPVALQLFTAQSASAQNETPQTGKIQLPKADKPRINRDWYPPAALKRREEALVMIAFKINESGRVVEPRFSGASGENEFHRTAIEFLTSLLRFSMPAEPELSRITQHEFRVVFAFNIDCEEKPRKSRPGQWEESDLEWSDWPWVEITTYVRCKRIRGT